MSERIHEVFSQSVARYASEEQEIRAAFSLDVRPTDNDDKNIRVELVKF
jgi:hypothetical protein